MADTTNYDQSGSPVLETEEKLEGWCEERERFQLEQWKEKINDPAIAQYILTQSLILKEEHHLAYIELEKVKAELALLRGEKSKKKKVGFLNVIKSCMFGGKTTHLLHLLDSYSRSGECLYVNHTLDKRSEAGYSTHNEYLNPELQKKLSHSRVTMAKHSNLGEMSDEFLKRFYVVCIDEAQFFPDLIPMVLRMIEVLGISTVCVAGIPFTFKRKPFGKLLELSGHADHITLLRDTPCNPCAAKRKRRAAIYSHLRKERSTSDAEIQIGSDQYLPVCRKCYLEYNKSEGEMIGRTQSEE